MLEPLVIPEDGAYGSVWILAPAVFSAERLPGPSGFVANTFAATRSLNERL